MRCVSIERRCQAASSTRSTLLTSEIRSALSGGRSLAGDALADRFQGTSSRESSAMNASMPANTAAEHAVSDPLLLAFGPAGVLSSRAIAAEDAVALWRLL